MSQIRECDFVFGIKRGRVCVIKDRNGETELDISFSELIQRVVFAMNNKNLSAALTPFLEKIRIYETFQ